MMKTKAEELNGLVLAGGIVVANSSEYKRATKFKPAAPGGKPITQFGTITRNRPKVGRNDPCPCGSGKKAKQCHPATTS
jgi:preprotein translocase subunit SecA